MRHILLVTTLSLGLGACSWVEVTPGGNTVLLATDSSQIAHCKLIGTVDASVMNRLFFSRDRTQVASELADLARNRAAEMGGDTITAANAIDEGKQRFNVYNCNNQ